MANRYWVGGTGTWNTTSTANWSTTSGGASGASAPGAADAALFNANCGTGTITIGENVTILSMTLSGAAITTIDWNNKIVSLAGNALNLYVGNSTVAMLNNPTITATYAGSTGTRTINGGIGVSEANAVSINVTGGTDIVTLGSGNNVYKNVNFTGFSGTLNAGNRYFYGGLVYTSGMTLQAVAWGTHAFLATSGTYTITMAGKSPDGAFTFNGAAATWQFSDALVIPSTRAVTFSAGTLKFKNGTTNSFGSFVTSGTTQKTLQSTLAGSQATVSQTTGTVSATYLTIKDINATGGATWNAYVTSNNVNDGNNAGWDFYLPSDSIYDSLRLRGYTGTVTDMLLQYYKYNGATSNSIQDAEVQYLVITGFTTGSNVDRWFAYLSSLGFTGTVSDMLFNYWKDPV